MVDISRVKTLFEKHQIELQDSIGVCILQQRAELDSLLEPQSVLDRRMNTNLGSMSWTPSKLNAMQQNGQQVPITNQWSDSSFIEDSACDQRMSLASVPSDQDHGKHHKERESFAIDLVISEVPEKEGLRSSDREARCTTRSVAINCEPSPLISDEELMATLSTRSDHSLAAKPKRRSASRRSSAFVQPEKQPPFIQRLVDSHVFEMAMGFTIVSNSVFIGVQVEHAASNHTSTSPNSFIAINNVFAFIFTMELMIRVAAYRKEFFNPFGHTAMWNYLDTFIVITTLWEVVMDLMFRLEEESSGGSQSSNLRIARVIRVVRFLRVIRMAKILRFVHALRTFIYSIVATLRSLVWALLLMFMICYICAIIFTQTVTDYVLDAEREAAMAEQGFAYPEVLFLYWGSLPTSMLTLFKSISGGLSWHDCLRPLQPVGAVWVASFLGYVAFTYFAVLNVVTGIFCQSAIDSAQNHEDLLVQSLIVNRSNFVEKMQRLFKSFDIDNDGTISRWEFESHMEDPSVVNLFESLQIDVVDACLFFKIMDTDSSQHIDFEEFVGGLMRLKGNAKRADFIILENKLKSYLSSKQKTILKTLDCLARDVSFLSKSVVEACEARGEIGGAIAKLVNQPDGEEPTHEVELIAM